MWAHSLNRESFPVSTTNGFSVPPGKIREWFMGSGKFEFLQRRRRFRVEKGTLNNKDYGCKNR